MILHENMVVALVLRRNPCIKIEDNKGRLFWFEPLDGLYYYSNPNNKKHNKTYVAKGLDGWYRMYLKLSESEGKNID